MKKLLLLFIALSGALHSKGQCPNPLGSSGGQQFGLCNPIYTVDFRNTTDCDLAIWWNYKTNCTDHLIQSYGPGTNVVPATPPPGTWSSHQVYEIKSILPNAGDGGNCNPSKCNAPCFMVVETPPNSSNFVLPTNLTFTQIPNGGTYCGWFICNGQTVCVTMMLIGPGQYSVDFHY